MIFFDEIPDEIRDRGVFCKGELITGDFLDQVMAGFGNVGQKF